MIFAIPLMIVPLAVYNAVAFGLPGFDWDAVVIGVPMVSGAVWEMTAGDLFISFAVFVLFLEVLKATRTASGTIVDHILSTMVLIGALIEFLLVGLAATSTFFVFLMIVLVDVIAGFSITIRQARRDFTVGPGGQL
ncbi:MAG: hypothetical protein AAFX39_00160 [Pseudomonadota bacterium]